MKLQACATLASAIVIFAVIIGPVTHAGVIGGGGVIDRLSEAHSTEQHASSVVGLISMIVMTAFFAGLIGMLSFSKAGPTAGSSSSKTAPPPPKSTKYYFDQGKTWTASPQELEARVTKARATMAARVQAWSLKTPHPNDQYDYIMAVADFCEAQTEQLEQHTETCTGKAKAELKTDIQRVEANIQRVEANIQRVEAKVDHIDLLLVGLYRHFDVPLAVAQQ
ncbi:uncharacterized protein LOC129600078 [Paramacrobiotus metropolitanus]|uniref:uncharacterized protein LOC129600078 n=1 Tax=Paramacrobiotus metropolitanus TaxID=2943436 RepID=UPI002445A31C|nr:uncharacterized protein LOC129600078 [Paramacrobiotus metropolitanus]XP_055354445.1 uncharacterized protein LOC129600078 [Paramacrobiotus metropolitanus]